MRFTTEGIANAIAFGFLGFCITTIVGALLLMASAKPEKNEVEPPKLPKIDRESALELLERGECIGGEIEEAKFTIFICKE